jgi:hypothetical protein
MIIKSFYEPGHHQQKLRHYATKLGKEIHCLDFHCKFKVTVWQI